MKPEIHYKKKIEKINKYLETEIHAAEQLLGQQRNQKRKKYAKKNNK